ncbi:MAG: 4-hydroxy-3-methylbut-2-enyl diphosphate reductase [Armatimonadota bacterium]|nr:4-hydroxy-3-methylbut-2-enyl diphosphate reductase [Armatimonadota bacterium]MDR7549219.1 4-hydroxy-3-methylbut-2-enyl diphosphate reductase [Armatimonadota bacterium]
MEVVLARHQGFCGGVRRAVEMSEAAARAHPGGVQTWGPLIHNPQVVGRLRDQGVSVTEDLDGLGGEAFVVSAYGVEGAVLRAARERGMAIIDATCPVVTRAHALAFKLADEGYQIIAVGDHGHPEMVTLKEALGDRVTIVHTREEAAAVKVRGRIGVISQTTQSMQNFREIVGDIALRTKELKVVNTLCPAITVRQEEAEVLVEQVDALVVVGGHHSSNTTRLAEIGRARMLPTFHIETPDEIDPAWFAGVRRVGVMSGASTPDWIIAEVVRRLQEIGASMEVPTAHAVP